MILDTDVSVIETMQNLKLKRFAIEIPDYTAPIRSPDIKSEVFFGCADDDPPDAIYGEMCFYFTGLFLGVPNREKEVCVKVLSMVEHTAEE